METESRTGSVDVRLTEVERENGRQPPESGRAAVRRASGLIGDIARDTRVIAEDYLELFKHDIRTEIRHARESVMAMAAGAVLLGLALVFLATSLCLGIGLWTDLGPWLGFLIVGGGALVLGAIAAAGGRRRLRRVSAPRAIEGVKEDVKWIADHS